MQAMKPMAFRAERPLHLPVAGDLDTTSDIPIPGARLARGRTSWASKASLEPGLLRGLKSPFSGTLARHRGPAH
ncbi:hypothetical protein IHE45_07G032300 [Dioscorea alata]|uniref:Uncharacterized protein n=1 Tax=Dioscorea alata TaxID=55571 RepID=A0ACB7VQJ1_DIOAL|nr:hypothetical protein IHE45_07G032300 [Dioscorea alata]